MIKDQNSYRFFTGRINHLVYCRLVVAIFLLGVMLPHTALCEEKALYINDKGHVGIGTLDPTARLEVSGDIKGVGMVPPGGIVMFSGNITNSFNTEGLGVKGTPYEGWQICNGKNNSPNLQDRFIVASGQNSIPGDQGGDDTLTLTVDQLPSHNHEGATKNSQRLRLNYGGVVYNTQGVQKLGILMHAKKWNNKNRKGNVPKWEPNRITTSKDRYPEISVNPPQHTHPILAQGRGSSIDNRPSFFVLAFIMRVP